MSVNTRAPELLQSHSTRPVMSTLPRQGLMPSYEFPSYNINRPATNVQPRNAASKDDLFALMQTVRQGFTLAKLDPITFDGNPEYYHSFIQGFENMIDRHPYPPDVKLAQLIQMCKGKAKDAIKHLVVITPAAEGNGMARKTLEFRFGNQTLVIEAIIKQLTAGPPSAKG
ncbi:uncharacterized protein LOC144428203 [Styela clava]